MILLYILLIFIFGNIICLFDEEIKMDKPIKGGSLFFRAYHQDNYMISNSITNYIFNIRNGEKYNFPWIIPLESTIYEPFVFFPFFIVDAHSSNNFVKIYDMRYNIYKEYTALKIKSEDKRKFCHLRFSYSFAIGVQDSENNFQIRLVSINGTEIFRSQILNITNSDDFYIFSDGYMYSNDQKSYSYSYMRFIYAIIFYGNYFEIHQWYRNNDEHIHYIINLAIIDKTVKQKNIQMLDNRIFCGQENGDVNCYIIQIKNQKEPYYQFINIIQMLQECKSDFKLNRFNYERYVISCLNTKNEFIIQLFSSDLKRDFDINGMILFKDDITDNYTYDVINGKNNELVILKADLPNNKYFIETFNFIKNSSNIYILCPPGCQDCYLKEQLGIQYNKNTYIKDVTLNCSLCKFNRYFADNYGDICFLKKEKPRGYEFIEKYQKFSSCDYCCKTNKTDYICDVCLNNEKYEYFVDEPNNGRCEKKCEGKYKFIKTDQKVCIDSCNGVPNCIAFNDYVNSVNR